MSAKLSKKYLIAFMIAITIVLFFAFPVYKVNAEEVEEPVIEEETQEFDIAELVDKFTQYLKDKYGEDYEEIYNGIIAQWGSIENYLLQFGDEYIPEKYNAGWQSFVKWLKNYAPIWATPLAIICVIIIAVFGRKTFDKIVDKITNNKLKPIIEELNKQSSAMATQLKALKAILPNNEKFSETTAEIESKEKELNN